MKPLYHLKLMDDGRLGVKHRIAVKGCRQRKGTYDPRAVSTNTPSQLAVLTFIAYCVEAELELDHLDTSNAHAHAPLKRSLRMEAPGLVKERAALKGMQDPVVRLHKSLHGLKQAGRNWEDYLADTLTSDLGFTRLKTEASAYVREEPGVGRMAVVIHVDDKLAGFSSEKARAWLLERLQRKLRIRNLGPVRMWGGIETQRLPRGCRVSQTQYIQSLMRGLGLNQVKASDIPMHDKGRVTELDVSIAERLQREGWTCAQIVGRIGWLRKTRVVDKVALAHLSAAVSGPTMVSWARLVYYLRYLHGTEHWGMRFERSTESKEDRKGMPSTVTVWADANLADRDYSGVHEDLDMALSKKPVLPYARDSRSRGGQLVQVGHHWVYGRSGMILASYESTPDVEYKSQAAGVKLGEEVQNILAELGLTVATVMKAASDNEGAIKRSDRASVQPEARHLALSCGVIADRVRGGRLEMVKVAKADQMADVLTKILGRTAFLRAAKVLMDTSREQLTDATMMK